MKPVRERLLLGALLGIVPALVALLVLVPGSRRLAALHRRIDAAHGQAPEVARFLPVGPEERAFLENPAAPWRTRLPLVADDAARLAHVDRVTTEWLAALAPLGLRPTGMRLLLDPVQAQFTLPDAPLQPARPPQPATDRPDLKVAEWVLEVEIPGPTRNLFRALAAVPRVNALLEPGGLRWEVPDETAPGAGRRRSQGHRQVLVLRSFYLRPGG
jgi:hypothetical protein